MTDVDDLLLKTSRTFAVTIPMLPAPTRQQVGVAYLLFRIIDTFEDGTLWPAERRAQAIRDLLPLLDGPDLDGARRFADRCADDPPIDHAGYMELLREIPFVLSEFGDLSEQSRDLIRVHVKRSGEGMIDVVSRSNMAGELRLVDVEELRDYCYVVAGIVGEMLTELFLLGRPGLAGVASTLRERAGMFGEALQLVNIIKDAPTDGREGRVYLPAGVDRADVIALAQADLRAASDYTLVLQSQGAEPGLVAFNALLVRLAQGTLEVLAQNRPSGKLTRNEVFAIVTAVLRDIEEGRPVLPVAGADSQVPVAI
jgi:farnesyl-diphosphate farnesyltransferase